MTKSSMPVPMYLLKFEVNGEETVVVFQAKKAKT